MKSLVGVGFAFVVIGVAAVPREAAAQFSQGLADGLRQGAAMRAEREQEEVAEAQTAAIKKQQKDEQGRKDRAARVGSLIVSDHCQDGVNLALAEGDFAMAQTAADFCSKRNATAAAPAANPQ